MPQHPDETDGLWQSRMNHSIVLCTWLGQLAASIMKYLRALWAPWWQVPPRTWVFHLHLLINQSYLMRQNRAQSALPVVKPAVSFETSALRCLWGWGVINYPQFPCYVYRISAQGGRTGWREPDPLHHSPPCHLQLSPWPLWKARLCPLLLPLPRPNGRDGSTRLREFL